MKPLDQIGVAKILVEHNPRRPNQACLRRAISSAYYAMFHSLAHSCADTFIGKTNVARSTNAWQRTYRSLEHGVAKNACNSSDVPTLFSQKIQDFASIFVTMQQLRHDADYDPNKRFKKSEVLVLISQVEIAITAFEKCAIPDRRAFAVHVLMKSRR
jgi:uncharacterized protein (UPF0332 family)